jgi:hypothetical protein
MASLENDYCPCNYCTGKREKAAADEAERDLMQYTVKCGYRGIEDLNQFHARKISRLLPGAHDLISYPCKSCAGNLEEIVSAKVVKKRK